MDGFEERLSGSIQRRLSATLSLAIFAVAVCAGVFSFLSAFDEAHELQDEVLRQVARQLDHRRLAPVLDARPGPGDEESRVIVERLGAARNAARGVDEGGPLALPAALPDGLQTVDTGGERFRVLVVTTAGGERFGVAQEAGLRNEIARGAALRTVAPLLALVPVLLLAVAHLVRKMFRPIAALSQEVDRRTEADLRALDVRHVPAEVRGFVVAINRLLERVAQSMDAQRRFVADAAHELRSPLTALSLQAERLAETPLPEPARERFAALRKGIDRGRNLLDQLLALARAQSAHEAALAPVSLQAVCRRVLEDLMPLAEARHIDIGIVGAQDAAVWAGDADLLALVRNLVDNAIRYSPVGGRVDLAVAPRAGEVVLSVEDGGPGIPPAERERVFHPFHRGAGAAAIGSGLGLSIVQAVAGRIGARIEIEFADPAAQRGTRVAVVLPTGAAAPLSPKT